ncbi:MAG TPA: Flp pilus assembly protein CpaB [Acidimicrobiia bacterium]|nr:Flp pilus assembly protein CpaB [Acidimicrobiia bacterium]
MRRSPRVWLAWAAAVLVILATLRVVGGDLGSLHRRAHDLGADVPVVLAARDLPTGTTIGAADVRVVHVPSKTVTPDALHDPATAIGRIVAVALVRDDVVGARHLVDAVNGVVPDGDRAVHVVVKDGFQPPPGSVVDVLATYDPALAGAGHVSGQSVVVARGARVLSLSGAPGSGANAAASTDAVDATGAGVTLLVSEAEARSVAYAASIGEVSLAIAPARTACCSAPASGVDSLRP